MKQWVLSVVGVLVGAGLALLVVWATSSGSTEDLRGGVPALTEEEIQEYATASWWADLDPGERAETCLAAKYRGEKTYKRLAEEAGLIPDLVWDFMEKECGL